MDTVAGPVCNPSVFELVTCWWSAVFVHVIIMIDIVFHSTPDEGGESLRKS